MEGERQVVDVRAPGRRRTSRGTSWAPSTSSSERRSPWAARYPLRVGDRPDGGQRGLGAEEVRGAGAADQLGPRVDQRRPGDRGRARRCRGRTARAGTPRADRNAGRISRHSACQGTKLELCSIIVVTTLSPSRNSVSSEYMTALMASVVLRYIAMLRRLGASRTARSCRRTPRTARSSACEALDWPRCTFSYVATSSGRGRAARAAAGCSPRCSSPPGRCGRSRSARGSRRRRGNQPASARLPTSRGLGVATSRPPADPDSGM